MYTASLHMSTAAVLEIRKVTVYNGRHREPGYGTLLYSLTH